MIISMQKAFGKMQYSFMIKTLKKLWIKGNCLSDKKNWGIQYFHYVRIFIYIGNMLYPCLYIILCTIAIIIFDIM